MTMTGGCTTILMIIFQYHLAGAVILNTLSDDPPENAHRQRFRPIYRKAEDKHYIKLIPDWFVNEKNARLPCWSLFITFRRRREWGFYTADGWKPHNELLATPYTGYGDSKQLKHRP
jgi:hypothetical protein